MLDAFGAKSSSGEMSSIAADPTLSVSPTKSGSQSPPYQTGRTRSPVSLSPPLAPSKPSPIAVETVEESVEELPTDEIAVHDTDGNIELYVAELVSQALSKHQKAGYHFDSTSFTKDVKLIANPQWSSQIPGSSRH